MDGWVRVLQIVEYAMVVCCCGQWMSGRHLREDQLEQLEHNAAVGRQRFRCFAHRFQDAGAPIEAVPVRTAGHRRRIHALRFVFMFVLAALVTPNTHPLTG